MKIRSVLLTILVTLMTLGFNSCEVQRSAGTLQGTRTGNPVTNFSMAPFPAPQQHWEVGFCAYEIDLIDQNGVSIPLVTSTVPRRLDYAGTDLGTFTLEDYGNQYVEVKIKFGNKCGIGVAWVYARDSIVLTKTSSFELIFKGQADQIPSQILMNMSELTPQLETVETTDDLNRIFEEFKGAFGIVN
jgi:hypothetical protein